jgi:hypothetical protein
MAKLKAGTSVFVEFHGLGTVVSHGKGRIFGAFTEVLLANGSTVQVHPSNVNRLCKIHGDINIDRNGKCLECTWLKNNDPINSIRPSLNK